MNESPARIRALTLMCTVACASAKRRDIARCLMSSLVVCAGAVGLLYSKDSPAPPPPIGNCNTGIPASLALVFTSPPLSVAVNSHLGALSVQAFDFDGNALRDVPVTFTAPASGPGGTFNVIVDAASDTYVPAPNPLVTTVNTPVDVLWRDTLVHRQ